MKEFRTERSKKLLCLVVSLGVMPGVSWGQADVPDATSIVEYLSEANAEALVRHADEYLELALLEQPHRYTRSQALYVLKKFFRQYSPDGFEMDHNMMQGDEWWLTGRYTLRDEEYFLRFYLRFGRTSPGYMLRAMWVIRSR